MKRHSILFAALLGTAVTAIGGGTTATALTLQIQQITPSTAVVGETIGLTVRNAAPISAKSGPSGQFKPFRPVPLSSTKILFPTAKGSFVEGLNLALTSSGQYTVQVPAGAVSGSLRLQIGLAQSSSTAPLIVTQTGLSIVNFAQFDVVGLKVDGAERLNGRTIPATQASAKDVFETRVAVSPGPHAVEVVIGQGATQPVIVWDFSVTATNSTITEIPVQPMMIGEYLVSSVNAAFSANAVTAVWQSRAANGTLSGYDFTFNPASGLTTWKRWSKTRTSVVAKGSVEEPATWTPNAVTVPLRLLRADGTLAETLRVNFSLATLTSAKGAVFRAK